MSRQLPLDLPDLQACRREDFFVSPANALALAALDRADWPEGRVILVGPEGSGKTHLARIRAAETGAPLIAARDLARADIAALAQSGRTVVEDGPDLAGDPKGETALFHLHNLLVPGGQLLVTARRPVRDWGLTLPDLESRLAAAPVARLDPPDDALLQAVLVKLFADRQVVVPPSLIPWLATRMQRNLATAATLVAALDRAALARKIPISRTLAAEVLDNLPDQ